MTSHAPKAERTRDAARLHHSRRSTAPTTRESRRRRRRKLVLGGLALFSVTALLASGCSASAASEAGLSMPGADRPGGTSARPSATHSPAASPTPSLDPVVKEITAAQWSRMLAAGLWRKGCPDVRDQLRRVEMNYVGFDGKVHRGVLVVNADATTSIVRIFTRLFEERFLVRRMEPTEAYDGDLNASLRADNTSAFNCRRPSQINAPFKKSPHANGRAIDINPLENPWKDLRTKRWSPSTPRAPRGRARSSRGAWSDGRSRRRDGSGRTSRWPTTCTSTPGIRPRPSRKRPLPSSRPPPHRQPLGDERSTGLGPRPRCPASRRGSAVRSARGRATRRTRFPAPLPPVTSK